MVAESDYISLIRQYRLKGKDAEKSELLRDWDFVVSILKNSATITKGEKDELLKLATAIFRRDCQ